MTPETSIRIIIGVFAFIAGSLVPLIAMEWKEKQKKKKPIKNLVRRGKENYPPVVNIWLDEIEEAISN